LVSSRRWTPHEEAALRSVTVWAGGRPLPLGSSPEGPVALTRQDWYGLEIRYPHGDLDGSGLDLLIDWDPVLGGFPLRFYTAAPGVREPEREGLVQLVGQRFIGECSLVLSYRDAPVPFMSGAVYLDAEDEVKEQCRHMREILQQENALVLDFYGVSHLWAAWNEGRPDDAPANLELFEMLRWAHRKVGPILRRIEADPIRDLVRVDERRPIHRAGPLRASSLRRAAADGTPWRPLDPAYPAGAAVPAYVGAPVCRESFANPENAFVREFVLELSGHASRLTGLLGHEAQHLRDLRDERLGAWRQQTANQLDRAQRAQALARAMEQSLWAWLDEPHLAEAGAMSAARLRSHRMTGHPAYRQLWQVAHQFRWGLRLADQVVQVERLPMRTRSINQLYELWLAAAVHRAMVHHLGFTPLARNGRLLRVDSRAFNATLTDGTTVELSLGDRGRCRLCYGKRYPNLRNSPDALVGMVPAHVEGQWRSKDTPDLALEFYLPGEAAPRIVTIDATYSMSTETLHKKSFYRDTIRSRVDPTEQESRWDYPVAEAWAAYPGTESTQPRRRFFTGGELGLAPGPGAEEALARWLQELLDRVLS